MQETRRTIQEKLASDAKHKDDLQAKLRETELHMQEYDRKKAKEKRVRWRNSNGELFYLMLTNLNESNTHFLNRIVSTPWWLWRRKRRP